MKRSTIRIAGFAITLSLAAPLAHGQSAGNPATNLRVNRTAGHGAAAVGQSIHAGGSRLPRPPSLVRAAAAHASRTPIDKRWAFRPPVRPPLPAVLNSVCVRNPIDRFVLSRLESVGLTYSPPAERLTLIRRVSFDLTGLPPTPSEIAAFQSDASPHAYEKVVERLLASPQYGERWARHWLDLARYADSEGFKSDEIRPDAWRYRDYVVRSFNADKPYDRFLKEQLAGDEIAPDDADARIATAFCRHWADESNVRDVMLRRQEILNDITDTTAGTMLGLTVGCARCHDHKYDPIPQKDYYRLQAFFAAVQPRDDVSALPSEAETARLRKQRDWEAKTAEIRNALAELERPYRDKLQPAKCNKFPDDVKLAAATPPERRTPLQWILYRKAEPQIGVTDAEVESAMKAAGVDVRRRWTELRAALASFDSLKPPPPPRALGITDIGPKAPKTFRLLGGVYDKRAEEAEPGFLSAVTARNAEICALPTSTGRRRALAEWIASPDNPLTARVLVNRLWQHHFGQGIVPSPSDFGASGERPTHPELLDWLATEFVRCGWSIKQMQRLMVTSAAYRQSADFSRAPAHIDPDNTLLWRFRRTRLEGECIRDAMLAVSGELNASVGGPAVMVDLPAAVTTRGYWKPTSDAGQQGRRSLYIFVKRNMRFPLFEAFDFPDTHEPCARRQVTTTAPQALLLLNDETSLRLAASFAERVAREAGADRPRQVERAYMLAFGRLPTYEENRSAIAFMDRQAVIAAGSRTAPSGAETAGPGDASNAKAAAAHAGQPSNAKGTADGLSQASNGRGAADGARVTANARGTAVSSRIAPIAPGRQALIDFCHALFNANEFCHVE